MAKRIEVAISYLLFGGAMAWGGVLLVGLGRLVF
jgi:hypothetical protein